MGKALSQESFEAISHGVKDVDFEGNRIVVRAGKGDKDRVTVLPESLKVEMQAQLARVKLLHEADVAEGFGRVYLPHALAVKYPKADRQWAWQWVFPAAQRSRDPRGGVLRRHHAGPLAIQAGHGPYVASFFRHAFAGKPS